MEDLVLYLAENLVQDPDSVQVEVRERGRIVDIRLRVAREDMGRVIGKGGRIANSMRSLVRVAALKRGKRANLEIR